MFDESGEELKKQELPDSPECECWKCKTKNKAIEDVGLFWGYQCKECGIKYTKLKRDPLQDAMQKVPDLEG